MVGTRVEVPTSKTSALYDEATFLDFQRTVNVTVTENQQDQKAPSTSAVRAGPIADEDKRPLLQQSQQEQGFQVTLDKEELKGRVFAVVTGTIDWLPSPLTRFGTAHAAWRWCDEVSSTWTPYFS